MSFQRTIRNATSIRGRGVHSGNMVSLTLRPAPADTGLVFRRVDHDPAVVIPVTLDAVSDTRMCTTLENNGVQIATVEHLMAAIAGMGLDNLWMDVDGPELPIVDGSSGPFIFLLQAAGVIEQKSAPKRFMKILSSVEVHDGDKYARFDPYEGFRLRIAIDFVHPTIKASHQFIDMELSSIAFEKELSRARTFGFLSDVDRLRQMNLARGSSLDNTVVLDDEAVMNTDGLRYNDEFVRHKALDTVGDLYLFGHPIVGAIESYKSGHGLNNRLMRALSDAPSAWEWATYQPGQSPIAYGPAWDH